MGQVNAKRIDSLEENSTFRERILSKLLIELDQWRTGRGMFCDLTLDEGCLLNIKYYSDPEKTELVYETDFSYQIGPDTVEYVSGQLSTFYNEDGSLDSKVSGYATREAESVSGGLIIQSCSGYFESFDPLPCD